MFDIKKSNSNKLLCSLHRPVPDLLIRVQILADELHFSSKYLSDLLKTHTGLNARQRIQNRLIEKAKEILTTTSLPVSEISSRLGFEYPRSLNKLFKNKTNVLRSSQIPDRLKIEDRTVTG